MMSFLRPKKDREVRFEDFFDLAEVQKIQDSFALATGVASLVTSPSGEPLTMPSNFTRLCSQVIRATETGCLNCMRSDRVLGAYNPLGPNIQPCMSGGLWDAGVSITVAGKHVANWLIGQVRCSGEDTQTLLAYAQTIGADPELYRQALAEVPFMPEEQFRRVADSLFVIANSLSEKAYQQSLLEQEKQEKEIQDTMREMLMDRSRDGIVIIGQDHRVIEANWRFADMLGRTPQEVTGLYTWEYEAVMRESEIREIFGDFSSINAVFETRHRRKDGTVFDVEVSTAGASIGDISCVIAICRDISERKQAERQVRQSEEHFRALFELSQDGFVLADPQGRFLDANKAYCALTGYSLPELRALGDFYAITPEKWRNWQRTEIWENLLLKTGDTGVYQKEYIHKDGHVFPVELRDFAVYDEEGKVKYAWGIVRDISERTQTEERMRTLIQVIEQSPVCIVMTDAFGNIEYVNPKFTQISGYSFEEVKGQNPRILNSGQKSVEEYKELWTTISSGRQWRGEFLNKHKDGSLYYESALIAPILDARGEIVHYVAIKEDITQRRRTEEELRKKEINFKKIVDILPQLVSYVDREMRYRFVNSAYASFFPADPIGKCVREVIGDDAFEKSKRHIEQVFLGKTVHFSATLPYPGIGERFIDVYLIPDYSSQGTVEGYYAILNDLSHLKKIEDSLRRAKDEAETASRLKSEFLANMSHEIRTPLNGILGMLQLMQSTNLDAEQQDCLYTAIKSSERLTRLLSDILDISKIEADKLVFREHPFDIEDVEQALKELFSQAIKERKVTYAFRRDSHVPRQVVGDEARLVQVLFNLVGNSLKFTEAGSVTVDVSVLPFTAGAPLRLLFSVRDTGLGMSDQTQLDIFEPFIQSDGSYTRKHQGVGLGLTIVRKLVQRMGGTLCMDSALGEGTSIYFSLPLSPAAECGLDAECVPGNTDALRGLKVLMVEDDAVNLLCGQRLLQNAGCVVTSARNGQEALERLLDEAFDLVLMDIQMPVLDGIQTTKAIRHAAPFAHISDIPIIALTAHAMAGDQEKFLAAEMNGYMSKPFDLRKMNAEIERVVRDRRGRGK